MKRHWNVVWCLVLSALALAAAPSAAQDFEVPLEVSERLVEVRLADGTTVRGRIVSVDDDLVALVTAGGSRLEFSRDQIDSIRAAGGSVSDGTFWPEDPSVSRLFFFDTGRPLRSGESILGTYIVILPFVRFGVTDRLTLGGGAPITVGELTPFYLTPKFALVQSETVNVSVGTIHLWLPDNDPDVGIAYGVGTFGGRDRSLTLGAGVGYAGSDFSSEVVGLIGGEARFARSAKFITENYILPEIGLVTGLGIRFLGERLAADAGIGAILAGDDAGCCLPLLNFTYSFGSGR